jgi:hypothetical protein
MLGATAEPTAAVFLAIPNWQQERVLIAAAEAVFDDKTLALFRALIKLGKKYADERNDLAHGIFGKSDQIPDGVLWIRSKDRIGHMIDVGKKSASGDITISDHHAIRQKIYVYELAALERLAAEMTDYHRLVYDFIPLISQAEGPSRDERYRQLCERPDVQAEINRQNDSRGERPRSRRNDRREKFRKAYVMPPGAGSAYPVRHKPRPRPHASARPEAPVPPPSTSSSRSTSAQMAAVMTMTPIIMSSPPTVARVGVTGPVIQAVCIRIELGAPARIVNYVLRRGRGGKRG